MLAMRFPLALALLTCAACSDPSLQVEFLLPEGLVDQVESASLEVIVPPQGAPFDCDDLAFAAVSDDIVQANTVEEVLLRAGGKGDLDAIPRKEDKLLVGRGFNAAGEEIVAGCAEYGVIEDAERLTIQAEIVTIAIIPAFDPTDVPGRSSEVRITDVSGESAPGIEVRWTRHGAGAEPVSSSAISDAEGKVLVEVDPPPLPGPVSIDVNAKWARTAPPVIVGFRNPPVMFADTLPNPSDTSLRNPEEIYQVGRIGPNGEMGLAAMGNPDAGLSRQVYMAFYDPAISSFRTRVSDPLPGSALSLALLTEGGRDRIFTASTTAAIEILPDGSLSGQPFGETVPLIRRFLPLGDCSSPDDVSGALAVFLDGGSRAIDADGVLVNSPFAGPTTPGVPLASGCLTSGDALHRAVAYAGEGVVTLVADLDVPRSGILGVVAAGMGFTQANAGEDALLLATTLGVEGTDIARFRILPIGDDELDVEFVTSDGTLTFAQSTSSGDFDGDGLGDVAAVLVFGDTVEATDYRIHVSLGRTGATGRVAGVSGPKGGQRPRIFIRDFDADGHDDILIGSNGSFEIFDMGPLP
jgi:hypothetical protein